jgi:hypothetical protein
MRLSLPSQRIVPIVLLGVLAAVLMAIVAGRLGGDGSNSGSSGGDAQQVVERAFSGQSFKSGKFDATAQVSLDGAPSPELSSFAIKMEGAFDNEPKPPKSEVEMSFSGLGNSIAFGFVSTGEAAYLTVGDRAYEVPKEQLQQASAQGQAQDLTALKALGVDPETWLVNPTIVGTDKVGGVETDHVTAEVNTSKLVDDLFALASRSGQQAGTSEADRQQAKDAVKDARLDLYVAKDDGSLRKLAAQARIEAPQQSGDIQLSGTGNVAFQMQFSDVNQPQKVSAPSDARPFKEFEPAFSSRFLSGLTAGSGAGSSDGSADAGSAGGDGSSGAGANDATPAAPSLPGNAQKYLDCVEKASSSAEVQQCAPLLQ